jgi:hypothetical protein
MQNPTDPGPDENWCYKSGTSMATPLVAGCAAVLREALIMHNPTFPCPFPTAALIKALLINGADILTPPTDSFTPSNDSGFGRVNIAKSITVARGDLGTSFREPELSDGTKEWVSDSITVGSGHTTLKATLVWSDPPGPDIQNPLVLRLRHTSGLVKGGLSNNNVQQVLLNNIPPGYITLTVKIVANILWESPQPFAIVWRLD